MQDGFHRTRSILQDGYNGVLMTGALEREGRRQARPEKESTQVESLG